MDLFSEQPPDYVPLADGACWLPGFALPVMDALWSCVAQHLRIYPPQQMQTPMGYLMSVTTSSMGDWGWVSSANGYGYSAVNPATQQAWPPIPPVILHLASAAALKASYAGFVPDSCLMNIYQAGNKMGLHQDKDEKDTSQPIVSVSLGIPATFLFGGSKRSDKTQKIPLHHGDVVVWGGHSRRFYHGVAQVKPAIHPLTGQQRINLTLRKAR